MDGYVCIDDEMFETRYPSIDNWLSLNEMKNMDSVEAVRKRNKLKELLERRAERMENIDPPNDEPFRKLACAVILEAAKSWHPKSESNNAFCREFFMSEDYLLWAFMAGINVEGRDILRALEANGGVVRDLTKLVRNRVIAKKEAS